MKRRILSLFISVAVMLVLVGCSIDVGEILEHPKQVAPSAQFEVSLMNQYILILNGATTTQSVNRDSIHLAVGMPDGYSVVAAQYYYANNLNVLKLASAMDTAAAEQMLRDSAPVYKSRATAMQSSPQFVNILKHRSYEAENNIDTMSITVNTDLVKNWSAWCGKVNITIPQGTPADTTVDTLGMPLGAISKSIFIWLTLKAKASLGRDTLYYFTKTAPMPALSDTANLDIGQIVFAPLSVTGSGVKLSNQFKKDNSALSINTCPGGATMIINFQAVCKDAQALEVFNVSGTKIADLSSALPGSNGSFAWNIKNSALKPGFYILRLKSGNGIFSTPLRML